MIEFPKLGLKFAVDRVAFEVSGISIYWYGIIIALGFLLAVLLGMRRSKAEGIDPENVLDLALIAIPISIVMARLYYVVFNWSDFSGNLLSIFNTRLGGLAIYGGIIGALISAYIFEKWKKINMLKLLDFGVPYLVLAQGIGRWGNFFNQEAFGTNTTLPWGMTGNGIKEYILNMQLRIQQYPDMYTETFKEVIGKMNANNPVHPTFLYESLLNISIFLFLIWYRNRKKATGEVFFLYMILYGAGRFFIEGLRTDSLMLGNFRVSQLLALLLVLSFTAVFIIRRKKLSSINEENVEIGSSSYGSVLKKLEEDAVNTVETGSEESIEQNTNEYVLVQEQSEDETDTKKTDNSLEDTVKNEKNVD
jgi:phosphatidylglycerol---prolipoprotein diacylglyceryl transferase